MNAFHAFYQKIKMRKTGRHEMDNKFLTLTFRHTFLRYIVGSLINLYEKSFIKSNTITLNYSLSIAFIQIKIKS